jgi:hypothetical protein
MSEGTVPLTPENAIASHFAAQKELRELYARLKQFEHAFVRYSKRKYSDAHVLQPAVEKLLGYKVTSGDAAAEPPA